MAKVMRDHNPIARANRIITSPHFQSYANTLQGMIPTSINMNNPVHNVWKRRNQTTMNLTDDDFPALEHTKKSRVDDPGTQENSSTTETTETLTTVDLDDIERSQNELKAELRHEIDELRKTTETMKEQLQQSILQQIGQLEQRIERNTQQMINSPGENLQQAMAHMNAQAERSERMMQDFMNASKLHTDSVLTTIQQQIDRLTNTHNVSPSPPRKQQKDTLQADGSLHPNASHTPSPQNGNRAVTGGI
jgi:DNA repair exonuclease SbcCD ATPase subunit